MWILQHTRLIRPLVVGLSTYRKIHPGQWEEIPFYDHPSGYERVFRTMTWLNEHQADPLVQAKLAIARPGPVP